MLLSLWPSHGCNRMRQNPTFAHVSGRIITVSEGWAAFSRGRFSAFGEWKLLRLAVP